MNTTASVEKELQEATDRILQSASRKKLIVAGPGTGKTWLFRALLEQSPGQRDERLVLTFINNLKDELDRNLGHLAQVFTLHAYCQHLLYRHAELRGDLSPEFKCYPGLASLIKQDWEWLQRSKPPKFVEEMRHIECSVENEAFYFGRADYYNAVDFDDSVYRIYRKLVKNSELVPPYELVLVDEFQDFNKMEAGIIDLLADRNSIVIAGDDDQALYSQLRAASWDHIRSHHYGDEYDVFSLPFCMRCTEVVVEAVNDIIGRARADAKLQGRIDKPFRFYEPLKGEVSLQYPKIDLVRTTVQRENANYFGRYIENAIRSIPVADIEKAKEDQDPVALVIGRRPYLPMIERHLINAGLLTSDNQETRSERKEALEILHENPGSNLGWRIILGYGSRAVAAEMVRTANEKGLSLVEVIPEEDRAAVQQEAEEMIAAKAGEFEEIEAPDDAPNIKLTSFEGSKGLSAQHIFLAGLHAGELPRNPDQIQDIEICRFVVGLTRTKKKCSLLFTRNFAGVPKSPSPFLGWIKRARFEEINVNAAYWKR